MQNHKFLCRYEKCDYYAETLARCDYNDFARWMGQLKGKLKKNKKLGEYPSITALALAYLEIVEGVGR